MKKLLLLLSFLPLCIWGNEGMWLPCCLSKQTQQVMKEMGLELSSEQLYNPGGKALANAVVSFGGFCSGVVVSPDGLVFTNHHCGYDAIQQHSSVEHDYLRDGFVADSLSKELPNPDLFVIDDEKHNKVKIYMVYFVFTSSLGFCQSTAYLCCTPIYSERRIDSK